MAAATTVPPKVGTKRISVVSPCNGTELIRIPAATTSVENYFSVSSDLITNMSTSYDYLFKLLLCGDSGVGKTSMLSRFVCDEINEGYMATVGIDFKVKSLEIRGKRIKVQIWDTAGQERFKALTAQYYRKAQGIILVYDLTNQNSFENTANWLRMIQENAISDVKLMLIANKRDIKEKRQVLTCQGKQLAEDNGMDFLETSACTSENISKAFTTLTENIFQHMQSQANNAIVSSQLSINRLGRNDARESSCFC